MGLHGAIASLDLAGPDDQSRSRGDGSYGRRRRRGVRVPGNSAGSARRRAGALREAFERRVATLGLLEDVVEFLRRWQIDPNVTQVYAQGRVALPGATFKAGELRHGWNRVRGEAMKRRCPLHFDLYSREDVRITDLCLAFTAVGFGFSIEKKIAKSVKQG